MPIINDKKYINDAEIIREKGTNRSLFLQGIVDKYRWVSVGSSYLPRELNTAYLWRQLQNIKKINDNRKKSWNTYYKELVTLNDQGLIELPKIPDYCKHNSHMFYIKVKNKEQRIDLVKYLKNHEISSVFHYIPLHSSEAGIKFSTFHGKDIYTTNDNNRLPRLPMYYGLKVHDTKMITQKIIEFFNDIK